MIGFCLVDIVASCLCWIYELGFEPISNYWLGTKERGLAIDYIRNCFCFRSSFSQPNPKSNPVFVFLREVRFSGPSTISPAYSGNDFHTEGMEV